MHITPLRDNVIIEPHKAQEVTDAGIFLPETAGKTGPEQGLVVAVGPGIKNKDGKYMPLDIAKGDKVLFTRGYSSEPLKIEGKEYIIIKADDIMAVVK